MTSPLGTGKTIIFFFSVKLYMLYVQYSTYCIEAAATAIKYRKNRMEGKLENQPTVFYSVAALYNDYQSEYHTTLRLEKSNKNQAMHHWKIAFI